MIDSAIGTVRSAGAPARISADTITISRLTVITDACRVARVSGVRLAVVGQAGQRRQEHEGDRPDQDDVGRRRLTEHIQDDDPEQHADRDIGQRSMEWVAQPAAVEQILIGGMARNRAEVQRWLNSPNGRAQPSFTDTSRASSRAIDPPPVEESTPRATCMDVASVAVHIPSTFGEISGISHGRFGRSSWIRRLWPYRPGGYISSCPKGQVRTARPHRGAILGTVPGAGFDGRKAVERGTRRSVRTPDLFGAVTRRQGGPPTSSFGRFVLRARQSLVALRCAENVFLDCTTGPKRARCRSAAPDRVCEARNFVAASVPTMNYADGSDLKSGRGRLDLARPRRPAIRPLWMRDVDGRWP